MNYIQLYEEFNNNFIETILNKIGKHLPKFGKFKMCFEFGKDFIIKFFQTEDFNEIYNCIQQKSLNLNILPKIYKVGMINSKKYNDFFQKFNTKLDNNKNIYFVIEEKVIITPELTSRIESLCEFYEKIATKYGYLNTDLLEYLQENIYNIEKFKFNKSLLNNRLRVFYSLLNNDHLFIFNRFLEIYSTLLDNDLIISDSNENNFAFNKKGEIILIDLADMFEYSNIKKFDQSELDYIL